MFTEKLLFRVYQPIVIAFDCLDMYNFHAYLSGGPVLDIELSLLHYKHLMYQLIACISKSFPCLLNIREIHNGSNRRT